jgi:hypothetical protein
MVALISSLWTYCHILIATTAVFSLYLQRNGIGELGHQHFILLKLFHTAMDTRMYLDISTVTD